tara:strand:- start:238 stop:855 length:618 start_codon:yes stop_codon:yes gene_type:complete
MSKYLVSILIPTLLERKDKFAELLEKIEKQIKENQLEDLVEILSICDNRNIKLSEKRNRMQQMAQGQYFMHLDDDDTISEDYLKTVIDEIKKLDKEVDVITYDQFCKVNGDEFIVSASFNAGAGLTPMGINDNGIKLFIRVPWQYSLWNTKKYSKIWRTDADTNAREDQNWLQRVYLEYPQTQHHIDKILHTYLFGTDGVASTCQ